MKLCARGRAAIESLCAVRFGGAVALFRVQGFGFLDENLSA